LGVVNHCLFVEWEQEKHSYVLIDVQSSDVIHHERMSFIEKERRNAEAMSVGEFFLVWMPLSVLHNDSVHGQAGLTPVNFG
jgi:hypothetical protein